MSRSSSGFAVLGRRLSGLPGTPALEALAALRAGHPDLVHDVGGTTYVGMLLPGAVECPAATVVDAAEARLRSALPEALGRDPHLLGFAVATVATDIAAWLPRITAP